MLDQHQPEAQILMHDGNDMLRNTPAQEIQINLESMIRLAKQRGITVILLGAPQPGDQETGIR